MSRSLKHSRAAKFISLICMSLGIRGPSIGIMIKEFARVVSSTKHAPPKLPKSRLGYGLLPPRDAVLVT